MTRNQVKIDAAIARATDLVNDPDGLNWPSETTSLLGGSVLLTAMAEHDDRSLRTALLTVRGKDHDLTESDLIRLAAMAIEAAARIAP